MIIRSNKSLKRYNNEIVVKQQQEEAKPLGNEAIKKSKKKKTTPVVEPVVEDIKIIEDEDLSKWLEEHTED